jgi:hypothetical protein
MNNDLPASGYGIKRVEQQVCNDLYNFAPESQNSPIRLKALVYDDSFLVGLGAIEI